ncbi:hypothetical protein [Cohnella terricola]|uniref:Uncharacterized protein n=1 Tax=Cohnella terricola TaxID=1289167 RepID=A0A559JKX3_9BACL|nr:hypothetical protein [Cohnella terricola]TVY00515.1 hypothetical protein FPZ45_10835 [Cohnella terricola]
MEMQSLQAGFANQDQAESVIRKLSALRGDCFRLERAGGVKNANFEFAGELGASSKVMAAEFTLAVNIPAAAVEQARTVIIGAGGQMM